MINKKFIFQKFCGKINFRRKEFMSSDKLSEVSITVQKRNGQIVAFNSARIKNAIANAFKEQASLPREADLSAAIQSDVDKVADCIFFVLNERNRKKNS